jgi:hypothetical protein
MRLGIITVGVIVAGELMAAQSPGLTGIVTDPQQRVVMGAKVELACEKSTANVTTNFTGQFTFAAPANRERCILRVVQQGFRSYERVVGANAGILRVQLKLAPVEYAIDVKAKQDRLRDLNHTTLETTVLSGDRLRMFPKQTQNLIQFAEHLGGISPRQEAIYVDDLPSQAPPSAEEIAGISVNDDPFSAEYADGDQVRVNIATKTPDRKLNWHFGGISFGSGGGSALDPTHHAVLHSGNLGLTGPIHGTPLTFSLDGNLFSTETPEPVRAPVLPTLQELSSGLLPTGVSKKTADSLLASIHYAQSANLNARFAFYDGFSDATNLMVGGLTLPEAGLALRAEVREFRAAFNKLAPGFLYQSGFVFSWTASDLLSNSRQVGLLVPGSFVAGGAAIAHNNSTSSGWFFRNSIQTSVLAHTLTAGVTVSKADDFADEQPNPAGVLQFESLRGYQQALLNGASTATWTVTEGNGRARVSSWAASPFSQMELGHGKNAVATVGLRADYQSRGGVILSPRFSAASLSHGFVFRAGGGMFVQNWRNSVLLGVLENDNMHLRRLLTPHASFEDIQGPPPMSQEPIVSTLSPDLTRPRSWMAKASVEHPFGYLVPGLEYTWTEGIDLLGSQRFVSAKGWIDVLGSDRSMIRHQLHASSRLTWKNQSFVLHYQWIHSRDNTDGAFSFPAKQNDLRSEWARSSGVSPHNVTLVIGSRIYGGIFLNLVDSWRSSAPYDVTTGLDPSHNGLFDDRGGSPRNSGNGPEFNSLAVYGYKRLPLPRFLRISRQKTYLAVGIQVENLLNRRNYSDVGSVLGSTTFGQPLTAMSGRSFRLSSNIDRGDDSK